MPTARRSSSSLEDQKVCRAYKVPKVGEQFFYGKSLGLEIEHVDELIEMIKSGFPSYVFITLSDAMGLNFKVLAEKAKIATRTLARRKKGGVLKPAESERVFRIAFLFDRAVDILGSRENAAEWMIAPKKALGGKTPLEYAETELGAREVEELLGRLEHGVFS